MQEIIEEINITDRIRVNRVWDLWSHINLFKESINKIRKSCSFLIHNAVSSSELQSFKDYQLSILLAQYILDRFDF